MTATVDASAVEAKPKAPWFGRKEKRAVLDPLWDDNHPASDGLSAIVVPEE